MTSSPNKAVVLLSGGLDSATCLAVARDRGFTCCALSFRYGQRHSIELSAAAKVATADGAAEHLILDIDLNRWGGSALTSSEIPVPKGGCSTGIPATYVPARNLIFLSFAVAWAETLDARDIFIGVNAVDYSGYPDCRPQFIDAFSACAKLGTKAADAAWQFQIHTPLQGLDKAGIIRLGMDLKVDYSLTHSCYDPDDQGNACACCESCEIRKKGFIQAGIPDPTQYQEN